MPAGLGSRAGGDVRLDGTMTMVQARVEEARLRAMAFCARCKAEVVTDETFGCPRCGGQTVPESRSRLRPIAEAVGSRRGPEVPVVPTEPPRPKAEPGAVPFSPAGRAFRRAGEELLLELRGQAGSCASEAERLAIRRAARLVGRVLALVQVQEDPAVERDRRRVDGWAREHACCVECGTVERPHRGYGLCQRCYVRATRLASGVRTAYGAAGAGGD